jgi:hypothetical protein
VRRDGDRQASRAYSSEKACEADGHEAAADEDEMTDKTEAAAELRQADFEAIHDLRRARYSQEASAIRSLQLANAGGSVALLAFLGQTWTVAQSLQMPLAISIGTMVAGLLLAVFAGFQLPSFSERRYL